jgi:hypothetical protein
MITPCLDGCAHHWIVDRPNGLFSHAVCKRCKSERDFINTIPEVSRKGISFVDPATTRARHDYLFLASLTWVEVEDYNRVLIHDRMRR